MVRSEHEYMMQPQPVYLTAFGWGCCIIPVLQGSHPRAREEAPTTAMALRVDLTLTDLVALPSEGTVPVNVELRVSRHGMREC